MDKIKILWADDEIDLLKPHVLFLEKKGYEVETVKSGNEAIEKIDEQNFNIVFLDENMPGMTGLDTLQEIKRSNKDLPVIMITKSEEEYIMEDAIGGEISDYLIKPVNPNQILLSIKKNLDTSKLIGQKSATNYQQEFRNIGLRLNENLDKDEWVQLYKDLVYWDLQLDKGEESGMKEMLDMQKTEANQQFSKFVANNYHDWHKNDEDAPITSQNLFKLKVRKHIKEGRPLYFMIIDCLRYDQWKILQSEVTKYFTVDEEDCYYSILPTATQYARNAIFAGLTPFEIKNRYPKLWIEEHEEGSKNAHEDELFGELLSRQRLNLKWSYNKIVNLSQSKKFNEKIHQLKDNDINLVVYNFVDALSHASTDTKILRDMADSEKSYRSLIRSWIENSPLRDTLNQIAEQNGKLIISTDHGTVKVHEAVKVVGDKQMTTNLRYKEGKNMQYNEKDVFEVPNPELVGLPKTHISSKFIFGKNDQFFAYPNNYNHYVKYFKNTFQHGGISLEEMIVPIITLSPK